MVWISSFLSMLGYMALTSIVTNILLGPMNLGSLSRSCLLDSMT